MLRWLAAAIVVALSCGIATLAMRVPTMVTAAVVERAAAAGIEASVAPLRLADIGLGGITFPSLALTTRGVTLQCQDVRLIVPLLDLVRGRRALDRFEASACDLAGTYRPTTAPAAPAGREAAADANALTRAHAVSAQALAKLGAIDIDRWTVDLEVGDRDLAATGERFTLRADGPRVATRSYARLRAPFRTNMASWEATVHPTEGVALQTDARIEIAGATVGAEQFFLTTDGTLRVETGALSMPLLGNGLAVGFNTVEVGLPGLIGPTETAGHDGLLGPCPRIRIGQGQIVLQRAAPPLEASPSPPPPPSPVDETPEEDPRPAIRQPRPRRGESASVGPTIGTQRLSRLLATGALLREQQQRALAAIPACLDLQIADVTLDFGHPDAVHIRDLQLHDDGRVVAEVAWRDIEVTVDTNRLALNEVAFEASGVPLSPLSGAIEGLDLGGTLQAQGTLALAADSFSFHGDVQIRDGMLFRAAISPLPLDGLQIVGETSVVVQDGEQPSVSWTAAGTFNGVPLDASVALTVADGRWRMVADGGVSDPVPCTTMFRAIPAGMLPNLGAQAMRFSGEAAPRLGVRYTVGDPWTLRLSAEGFPGTCLVTDVVRAWDPRQLNATTYRHHVTEGTTLPDLFVGPATDNWVALESLPPYVPAAMFLSEEIQFYTNPGISLGLIQRGTSLNLERGRYAYGGSTVSQQLVKNLFLSRAKTLSRKLEEVLIVWAMEQWVTKDRILELYLNCIEFGPNLYGLQAASRHYFDVEPQELTPLEATFLAGLKPSPLSGARHRARGASPATGWWPERNHEILSRMVRYGYLPAEELEHYAPYVIAFPPSPLYGTTGVMRIPRPDGAPVLDPRIPVVSPAEEEFGPDTLSPPLPLAVPPKPASAESALPSTNPAITSPQLAAPVPESPEPVPESPETGSGPATRFNAPAQAIPAVTPSAAAQDQATDANEPETVPVAPLRRPPTAAPSDALQQLRRAQ